MPFLPPSVAAYVRKARVARLATVDAGGRPHIVPVCFVFSQAVVYTPLDEKPKEVEPARLRRVRNIVANPAVQVLVDAYAEDWDRLAYVQLRGTARLLPPGEEQAAAVVALREKYVQYRSMALEERPVIRVAVESAVWWGADWPRTR